MNKIRNLVSVLLGLVVLAGLVVGLAWLLGPQGTLPAQQVSPVQTPTRPATTPTPVETPTPWLNPTPRLTPTPRPTPTPWPTPDFTAVPIPTPLPEGTFGILYVTQTLWEPFAVHTLAYDPGTDAVAELHTIAPRCWDMGNYPVSDLSLSPDRRYIAIQTLNEDGMPIRACVTSLDGRQSTMLDPPGEVGSQFLGWIPGSDAALVEAGLVGIMSLDTGRFQEISVCSSASGAVSPAGRIVLVDVDYFKFALPDATIYNDIPIPAPPFAAGAPYELAWAPDGETLAYVDDTKAESAQFFRVFDNAIWVLDVSSGDARQVSVTDGTNYAPAWSPDSRVLVYVREEYHDSSLWSYHRLSQSPSSVWIVDVATGQRQEVLSSEGYLHWNPVWLPDGSGIVFVSNRGGGNDLWLVRPDGSGLRQLTDDGNVVARPVTFR